MGLDTIQNQVADFSGQTESVSGTAATMTEAQKKFVDLDRDYCETIKPFLDQLRAAREAVVAESPAGSFFQDDQGVVYKIDEKKWTSVPMEHFEIKRTRRDGEAKGSLSMTEARDAGFTVEGK